MAKQPTPIIEVVLRDEVTLAADKLRRSLPQQIPQDFRGLQSGIASLEHSVARVSRFIRRELGSLVGVAGVGGFLGGGLVAGLAKATQALEGLSQQAIQTKYTAEALGLTEQALNRLTVRGMALGQSKEQAGAQIKGLIDGLEHMKVQGTKASEWQRLMKGIGGERFGRELMRIYQGQGGEAAARFMAERMDNMSLSGQRALTEMFNLGAGFKDMFKVPQSELQEIFQLSEPEAKKYALAMANLNISFSNIKLQLATAMMPLFERMATAFDKFLRGPGAKMAKDFGAWISKLDIDWDKVAKGVKSILDSLTNFFVNALKFFKEMDPIVQQMGGWKAIIIGLGVVLGTAGLAGFLGGIGPSLILIGNAAWVVPLIAMVAFADKETGPSEGAGKGKRLDRPGSPGGGASAAPGSSPGGSGNAPTIDLPDVTVKPPRTRRQQRSDIDPENAAPYRVASLGWQPPPRSQSDTSELRREVSAFTDQVQAFSSFVTSQIPLSDASGAGGLAGMAGAFTGGGTSGGGGFRPGGRRQGGGGGWSRPGAAPGTLAPPPTGPAPTSDTPGIQAIIDQRRVVMDQLRQPGVRSLAAWAIAHEMGGRAGRGDVLESLVNRANVLIAQGANPNGLVERLLKGGFYGPIKRFYAKYGRWPQGADWALEDFDAVSAEVGAGRNRIGGRTDQGMRREVGGGNVRNVGGEWYGDHSKTRQGTPAERGIAARNRATEGYVPGGSAPPATGAGSGGGPNVQIGDPVIGGAGGGDGLVAPVSGTFVGGGKSHYGAARGGGRPHSGTDMQADNGSRAVAMIDGVVTFVSRAPFTGKNYGNQVVVKGTDGIYRRYAVHGQALVNTGQQVRQGQPIGIIAGGHLHYEEIHPTLPNGRPNPTYQQFERSGNADTSYQRGTTNPAQSLGLQRGTSITAGQPINPAQSEAAQEAARERSAKKAEEAERLYREWRDLDKPAETPLPFSQRARASRLNLNIRVRGPRGVKVSSDSDGVFAGKTNVARDIAGAGLDAM